MQTPPDVACIQVHRVLLVHRFERPTGHVIHASSLPGHLIQLVVSGHSRHEVSGRRYTTGPGTLIWYHDDELVRGGVDAGPWSVYAVNFIAPGLPPPEIAARVRQVGPDATRGFEHLLQCWDDTTPPPGTRALRVQSALLGLLTAIDGALPITHGSDPASRVWWELETLLRRDLSRPQTLQTMSRLSGCSASTLARACRAAVGTTPLRRMKQVRLGLARGLVLRSDTPLKEIAGRVGYGRVHEFTRDYSATYGKPPGRDREEYTPR